MIIVKLCLEIARRPNGLRTAPCPFVLPSPADLTACQLPRSRQLQNRFLCGTANARVPNGHEKAVTLANQPVRAEGLGRTEGSRVCFSQAVRSAGIAIPLETAHTLPARSTHPPHDALRGRTPLGNPSCTQELRCTGSVLFTQEAERFF